MFLHSVLLMCYCLRTDIAHVTLPPGIGPIALSSSLHTYKNHLIVWDCSSIGLPPSTTFKEAGQFPNPLFDYYGILIVVIRKCYEYCQ
jgi:hypothetical protein